MRTIIHDKTWIAAAIVAATVGCKVGNPMDRTVKVTQQPSVDEMEIPSPQTRLARGSLNSETEAAGTNASARFVSERSPHEATLPNTAETKSAIARKTPTSTSQNFTAGTERAPSKQPVASSKLSNPLTPAAAAETPEEFSELLDAFRDSPPEVQQQALRQLLAVSGRAAPKTDSPRGIAAALKSSFKNLPVLPEDSEEPTALPTRLGADQSRTAPVDQVIQASGKSEADDAGDQIGLASGESSGTDQSMPAKQTITAPEHKEATAVADPGAVPLGVPVPHVESMTDAQLYEELANRLKQAAAGESDADRYRRQIIARHLMMFAGNPDGAVAALEGMTPTEQEFLQHYLLGVWSMVDTSGHPVTARRWSAALPEIRLATQKLAASSESLDVRSLAFCKEIQSFGQITKFDTSRFDAGQKVILYCEIDNFVAKSTADGFETQLQGSYEIFDAKGQKVAGQVLPADKQLCANYLRDYFIAYQMSLPAGLEPGDYRLELTMECLNGQKYGQASIPLAINRTKP